MIIKEALIYFGAYFTMSYVRLIIRSERSFHEYQAIWEPIHGEELDCSREIDNPNDPYAVSVTKGGKVVGHVPRKISRMCAVFMKNQVYCNRNIHGKTFVVLFKTTKTVKV